MRSDLEEGRKRPHDVGGPTSTQSLSRRTPSSTKRRREHRQSGGADAPVDAYARRPTSSALREGKIKGKWRDDRSYHRHTHRHRRDRYHHRDSDRYHRDRYHHRVDDLHHRNRYRHRDEDRAPRTCYGLESSLVGERHLHRRTGDGTRSPYPSDKGVVDGIDQVDTSDHDGTARGTSVICDPLDAPPLGDRPSIVEEIAWESPEDRLLRERREREERKKRRQMILAKHTRLSSESPNTAPEHARTHGNPSEPDRSGPSGGTAPHGDPAMERNDILAVRDEQSPIADDAFDLFSAVVPPSASISTDAHPLGGTNPTSMDDEEGYYRAMDGGLINDKYRVVREVGRGVYANVVRAVDTECPKKTEVAIKIVRRSEDTLRAGEREKDMLKLIKRNDKHNTSKCVRFISSFTWQGHACLVLEPMRYSLRDMLSQAIADGNMLPMDAVSTFSRHMLLALKKLRSLRIIHLDVKPDNMLLNSSRNVLKLCDFGSAKLERSKDTPVTPYAVARYYRPPEVILGVPLQCRADIWSAGCCMYEMVSGRVCFKGRTNTDLLRQFMEAKGSFNPRMIKKGLFGEKYFRLVKGKAELFPNATTAPTATPKAKSGTDDVDSRSPSKGVDDISTTFKGRNFAKEIIRRRGKVSCEEKRLLAALGELISSCLSIDPNERPTPKEALRHPFFL